MTSLTRWTATGSLRGGCVALLALTLAACGGRASSGAPEPQSEDAAAPPQDAATDAPGLACAYPKGDCNDDPSDGCETDLTTNRSHCGSCSHDCGCGDCASGKCVPRTLADVPRVFALQLDETSAFVAPTCGSASSSGAVYRIPKDGGAPSTVFDCVDQGMRDIRGIAVDDTNLFATACWVYPTECFQHDGQVIRVPKDGGQPTVLAQWPVADAPEFLAVDGTYVYWYGSMQGTVLRVPKAGGSSKTLAAGLDSCGLASDEQSLYLTDHSFDNAPNSCSIVRLSKLDGSRQVMVDGLAYPISIAVNSTSVFWTSEENALDRASLAGGSAEVLDTPKVGYLMPPACAPGSIAADEDAVYWIAIRYFPAGSPYLTDIVRTDLATRTQRVLASDEDAARQVAIDDACVYWTVERPDGTAGVRAIAKE